MSQYAEYPPSSGGGVVIYPNFAAFPATAPNGTIAKDGGAHILYEYNSTTVMWEPIASNTAYLDALAAAGAATSIGPLDSQPANANGLALVAHVLSTQSADATHPGMVNTAASQTFGGAAKIFTGTLAASNLSGTNTGDVTIGTANGLSLSAQVLSLAQATVSTPGAVPNIGGANGVAPLDAGTKIPVAYLPSVVMLYLGNWDASTNTPTLADGTGTNGDVYRTSVAGTQNLGSGPQTFFVGDFVIYNGSIWQRSPTADGVISVNGLQGAVVLTQGNLTDAGTDGITITGGTNAVWGTGTSISQHVADTTHNGYLSSADWNTFNGKQSTLTFGNLTDAGTDGIVITGGSGAVIGSGTSISQHVADATHNGYLSSTDWNTFNNKQPAGNYANTALSNLAATSINQDLIFDQSINHSISAGTQTGSNPGRDFTLQAGSAASGSTDNSAGGLNLNTGLSTGIGDPNPIILGLSSRGNSGDSTQNTIYSALQLFNIAGGDGVQTWPAITLVDSFFQDNILFAMDASASYIKSTRADDWTLPFILSANTVANSSVANSTGTPLNLSAGPSSGNAGADVDFLIPLGGSSGTATRTPAKAVSISGNNEVRMYSTTNTAQYVGLNAPASGVTPYTVSLPAIAPTAGQLLSATSTTATTWQNPTFIDSTFTITNSVTAANKNLVFFTGNQTSNTTTSIHTGSISSNITITLPTSSIRLCGSNGPLGNSGQVVLTNPGFAQGITELPAGSNGQVLTLSSGVPIWANSVSSFVAPTIQTFTSGSGTYTLPTSPRSPLYIRVRMVGGGGGGGGEGVGGSNGGAGGDTGFGPMTAKGGSLGTSAGTGGAATSGSTLGSGPIGTVIEGAGGGSADGSTANTSGGSGGSSAFGGAGQGGIPGTVDATSATANSGSGGGGGELSGASGGGGGGAGAFIDAIIPSPSATYTYAVGSSGSAGGGAHPGGAGASGYIEVTEFYQ